MTPAPADGDARPRLSPGLRVYAAIRSGLLTIAALLGVVCIAVFALALITGIRPVVVISGSMEPEIPVGAVVFTQSVAAAEFVPGDIVTVERPRGLGLVTHRLVSSTDLGDGTFSFVLRGDANDVDDPQPYTVTSAGRYVFHVVALGYVTLLLQSTQGLFVAGGIALALIALFILDPARLTRREADAAPPPAPGYRRRGSS
ncbi:signal peptidase I [Microbacterium hominis]|nr:signal peptidase I [Microbacterium hominis]